MVALLLTGTANRVHFNSYTIYAKLHAEAGKRVWFGRERR